MTHHVRAPQNSVAAPSIAHIPAAHAAGGRVAVNLNSAAGGFYSGTLPKRVAPRRPPTGRSLALHVVRRATLGFNATDVARCQELGAHAWLTRQLRPSTIPDTAADHLWHSFKYVDMTPAQVQRSVPQKYSWDAMFSYAQATLARQLVSRRQLYEVMVDFWANHLNVAIPSDNGWDVGPDYHNRVIRKYALGTFEEMLLAAGRHPGLLRFLSADQSMKQAVNENLGRELLELHTVGLQAGYTETDVRNSAYILTGRTVSDDGTFHYEPSWHWTGPVKVMGFRAANGSAAGGLAVGDAYLRYLAHHPMTASHIARKLAIRFVSDTPSDALVKRLAAAYTRNRTAVVPVLLELFASAEFQASAGQKTRRPLENILAAFHAVNAKLDPGPTNGLQWLYWTLYTLGHAPLAWPAPNGYPDVAAAWASPGSIVGEWNVQRALVLNEFQGIKTADLHQLAGGPATKTVQRYLQVLTLRLTGQSLHADHLKALLAFAGVSASAPLSALQSDNLDRQLAALILGSPYLAMR